jgi:hypothetical protein
VCIRANIYTKRCLNTFASQSYNILYFLYFETEGVVVCIKGPRVLVLPGTWKSQDRPCTQQTQPPSQVARPQIPSPRPTSRLSHPRSRQAPRLASRSGGGCHDVGAVPGDASDWWAVRSGVAVHGHGDYVCVWCSPAGHSPAGP